jgi:hypothetical protein
VARERNCNVDQLICDRVLARSLFILLPVSHHMIDRFDLERDVKSNRLWLRFLIRKSGSQQCTLGIGFRQFAPCGESLSKIVNIDDAKPEAAWRHRMGLRRLVLVESRLQG